MICISLTILAFSVVGRSVYAKILTNEMASQADLFAAETIKLLNGEITYESYRFMMDSIDSKVILLDSRTQPFDFSEYRGANDFPHQPDGEEPARPDGEEPQKDGDPMRNEENLQFCRALYGDVTADRDAHYISVDNKRGAIAASLIKTEDGTVLGAVFLIRPMNDISSTSRSLLIVLAISAAAVSLLMIVPLYFTAKRLTDPLKNLTVAAADLSSGNYSRRVDPEGSHEVRELGSTFNMLASNLQENIGELTVERNRLQAILDGLGEGIIGFDRDGSILKYNSSAARLLGGSASIEGLPELARIKELAGKALASGEGVRDSVKCGERVVGVSVASIETDDGSSAGAVALLLDVTEAERLEQTRRDYVANVSHELRTPLASIRGIADMLNDGLVESESDKLRYYGYILKESIRLSTLINDLLELSRLQSGGVALKLRRMELYEMLADVADRMTDPARDRGMTVDLTVPEGRYYARSNPDRVEQVLISLIDNAVKHGAEGGTITVGMYEKGEKWEIFVENPAEIERKDLDHIFERFYKADIAHSSEGTGLGLAITEEVLQLLGETIGVDYENGLIRFTFTVQKNV